MPQLYLSHQQSQNLDPIQTHPSVCIAMFGIPASDPLAKFFFKFRLADKKIQLISGLAEYSRNLRNSAGIWLTNDKFGWYSADIWSEFN